MTPEQKIKREILLQACKEPDLAYIAEGGITEETVDEQYNALTEEDAHWDYESEFRHGQVETKMPCDWSRHYESKSVGSKLSDGTWIGWTFWYGDSMEWMSDAYELEVTETEKLVIVREFKKKLTKGEN
jgi:hypothetical protein